MAEESTEEGTEKKPNNMLMIIIIVVLVIIILGGVIVGILLMSSDDEQERVSVSQAQERPAARKSRGNTNNNDYQDARQLSDIGILYPLDTFTVNLKSDAGRRYLKVTMSLELDGDELSLELDAKSPVLRDRVIRILTSKTLEEISSKQGKQKVSDQVMNTLNAMISDGEIRGIYFTEFVIQ